MDKFTAYLEDERSRLEAKEAELCADERKDESDMEKVKFNVFGICLAIYQTVKHQCEPEALSGVYLKRLEEFPEKWETSLKKAEQYEDAKTVLVEQTKLETLREIHSQFLELRG